METHAVFAGLVDLASEKIGAKTLGANDAFFAEETNLLKSSEPVFIPGKYTDAGKWMDGWETRRRRTPGFDWCILQLGVAGTIKGLDIDTRHFWGNHPPYASMEACRAAGDSGIEDLEDWKEILPKSPLNPGSQNFFSVVNTESFTHVKLKIFPDGGVARLRVYGEVYKDWASVRPGSLVDLAALVNGGKVLSCNDMFFGDKTNLILPGRARNMGEGWETKRKRVRGHDWCIIKLARPGILEKMVADTLHFKGNFPDRCSLDGCFAPEIPDQEITETDLDWVVLLPEMPLTAHREHVFDKDLRPHDPISHVRFNIFPDGGVSRLRLFSRIPPPSIPTSVV